MTKKNAKSLTTLAEDLRRIREARRRFTPQEIQEINKLLEGLPEKSENEKDKRSARLPETEA